MDLAEGSACEVLEVSVEVAPLLLFALEAPFAVPFPLTPPAALPPDAAPA